MIEIINIKKTYNKGSVVALNDFHLSIQQGELFGLIGPDGAGKTSLIRIISSLLLPDRGSVTVLGHDVVKEYEYIRSIIGYMPGKFSLYQDLSVEENLNFFAKVFNADIQKNYHLIKELYDQLSPFKNRRAGKLSGGMKQKLALCCALIHEPKLLLLDEPTTGVDPVSRKEFWDMLLRLKAKGITILVSTPYMDEATLCDRVVLIQEGKILDIGTPDEICNKSGLFIFAIKSSEEYKLIKALQLYENIVSAYSFGNHIHTQIKDQDPDKLNQYLIGCGIHDFSIERVKPGIEDVFMHKMVAA